MSAERLRVVAGLQELQDLGLVAFELTCEATGQPATAADLASPDRDAIHMQVLLTGKSADGLKMSVDAATVWRGLMADADARHAAGFRSIAHEERLEGTRTGRRCRLSCGHTIDVYGSLTHTVGLALCPQCRPFGGQS